MSIVDYLYRGAPTGERAAVQTAVQNTPYSTIGKNIIAEGAFGKGSNLRGFDPNFKGGTNLFNYVKGGISSLFGGKAPGNIGGGTPAQRQLFEKVLQSPITRTVGPVVRSALSLPMTLAASGPYAISKLMEPRTEAGFNYMKDFDKGAITGVFDETAGLDDFQNFGTGIMQADAAATQKATSIDPNVVAAIDAQTADEQAQLPIDPVDNRNIFSRFKDFAAPIAKDIAGRTIASQALGGAGGMLFGLPGALLGTIFGGIKGGGLFDAPYIGGVTTVDEFGNIISGEELDKQNALGGYYSDAARASRSRDARIAKMRERQALGKRISEASLARLEELQAKEEAARQAEFDRIMSSEQSQKDFYDSLNEGRGATSTAESRATAGDAPGYSGPSPFAKGGIVGLL
jgi:hypothetical protein